MFDCLYPRRVAAICCSAQKSIGGSLGQRRFEVQKGCRLMPYNLHNVLLPAYSNRVLIRDTAVRSFSLSAHSLKGALPFRVS
jgi:hypothetical protein